MEKFSFRELLECLSDSRNILDNEDMIDAFNDFDSDGDGKLTLTEYLKCLDI